MKKTIITCDVCKEEKSCETVILSFSSYDGRRAKSYDICRYCGVKADLFKEEDILIYTTPQTPADKLFELLTDIAQGVVEDNRQ